MAVAYHLGAPLVSSKMEESREGKMKADGSLKEGNPEFSYRGIETGLDRKSGPLDILRPIELAQ